MRSNKKNLKKASEQQFAPKAQPVRSAATRAADPVLEQAPVQTPAKPVAAKPVTAATPVPATPGPVKSAASKPAGIAVELVNPNARQVFVAGTFNGWKPEATPLEKAGQGRWVGRLNVPPGRHEYLFVVDGQWVPDPNAKETVQNPFGGKNCVLSVAA